MSSVIFQNAMRVIAQVLDWFQSSLQVNAANRINDYSQAGVVKNELATTETVALNVYGPSEFLIVPGSNNTHTTPSVSIGSGVGYDINAQRVIIPSGSAISYNIANTTTTTNDGLGNMVLTPQSSGNINVPLNFNNTNYVWITYLATIDPTAFTLNKVTQAKQFYEQTDGYQITVTSIFIAPFANSILLGNINLSGSADVGPTTISQAGRTYSANYPYRTLVQTALVDKSDATVSYPQGNVSIFADDHVKAIGTGIVTPQNPHGTSAADIGISGTATIQFHQEFLHSPGLVGGSDNLQAHIITIGPPGFDQLSVNPIGPNEVLTSNGISLTDSDISSTTILPFSAADAPGTWYIYADVQNKIVARTQINLIVFPDPNKYVLYTVFYTFPDPDPSNGHLSALTDYRIFGNIAARELQIHSVTGPKIDPATLGAGLSKDGSDDLQVTTGGSTAIAGGVVVVEAAGVAGAALSGSGQILNVNVDGSSIIINGSNQLASVTAATPVDNSTIDYNGSSQLQVVPGGITSTQLADGAASVRINVNQSFSGGIPTGPWQAFTSSGFTIPSTSQPVMVNFSWAGSANTGHVGGLNGQGLALAVDGVMLMAYQWTTSASSYSFPAAVPGSGLPQVPSMISPNLILGAGGHTIEVYIHGTSGTGGGAGGYSVNVAAEFVIR